MDSSTWPGPSFEDDDMMMAFDSSKSPPARLDEATIAMMRSALRSYLSGDTAPGELRTALRAMSSEARERSMQPEQLLVALKDAWNMLPEVRAMQDNAEQTRLLQRVVTMCIKEYFE